MIFKTLPSIISSINQLGEASNKLKAIDFSIVGLNTGNIDAYRNAISGISKEQAALLLSTQGLNQAQIDLVLSNEKVTASEIAEVTTLDGIAKKKRILTVEQQKQLVSSQALTTEKLAEISATLGLETAENGSLISKKALSAEMVKQQLESIGIVGSTQAQIMSMLGLSTAETSAATASNVLSGAMAKLSLAMSTNPIGALITVIGIAVVSVFGLTKAFDALTNSAEEIDERVDNLISKYSDLKTTADNNASTVESLADEYESLSKGVNDLGENVSLTSEEYARYNEIVNKIADMFPTLITGYTDEGSAILSLKGNVELLRDAYKEAQQEAYNLLVATGKDRDGNDIMESYKNLSELDWWDSSIGAEDVTTTVKRDITKQILDLMSNIDTAVKEYDKLAQTIFDTYGDKGYNFLEEMGLPAIKDVFSDASGITEEALIASKATVQSYYQGFQSEIDTKLSKVKLVANAFLNTNDFYLDDSTSSELKNALSVMVNSIDEELANTFNGEHVKVGAYVNNIVDSIKDNKEAQEALINLFTMDTSNMSIDKIKTTVDSYVDTIATAIGEEDPIELKARLGFENFDETDRILQNAIRLLTDDHGTTDRVKFQKLFELLEKEGISLSNLTLEQADLFITTARESNSVIEFVRKYKDALADAKEASASTPLTITQTVDQINTRLKSAFGSLQSAYQEIFTLDENTGEKIFASLDEVDITDKFQPILDALQALDELDGVTVDYSAYEDFVSVLSDTSSTAEEVQEQFDRLATDIIYTSDCTNMSAETFNLLAESLSEMGVANAYEMLGKIRDAQEELAELSYDAETAILEEGKTIKELGLTSIETEEYLRQYLLQKNLAQNPLNTVDDITQLEKLCKALGVTGEMYEAVNALKSALESKENGNHSAGIEQSIKDSQQKIQELARGYGYENFKFNFEKSGISSSKSASSAKATAETFDWVSQAIEHVEKEIEELDDTANSSYSTFSEKNEAFAQEIRKVSDEIGLQQQAYKNYMQKADAVGLSDPYRDLVENGASVMEDISDEALKNQISEYQKWYDKAQETQDKINSLYEKSKDIHVASYENCVQELDTLRDNDSISEREYLDRMSMLWETYYADQTEYAVQAKEAKLELLKREKSYLESVADAASNLLNGQAEELRNRQEAEIEVLEAKKRPLEAQLELLEAQEEKEDRILALQKAQYELKRAEHQRDKLTYVDGQMVYRADEAGIRNAKDAVDDAEYNIVKGNIQDRIDAYDKEIDKVKERYETEIAGIERLENEWQKALALRENALTAGDFESMFGEGSIEKLLSGDSSMISTWRQAYLEALGGIDLTANGTIGEMTARYAELAGLDLSSITEQTMTVASQFHAIHDAVGRLNASIASKPATDTPDGTSAKQTQSSEDSLSLSGALQNTYDIASEVLPEEAEMLHTIAEAANTAAAAIHELKTAIASLSALPLSPDSLTISGNAYASGTRRAQKGLAVIGEEKPEMIITNGQKAFLAKQPTLLRMEGGETVYNGEETERMLKARGFQPVTPDKFPLLKSFASYRPSEIRQRFVPQMISPANTAAASAIQNAGRAVNNSFNNGTSFTTGDVHIHCPGITKDEVAKQIGTELTNVFSGMSLNAYQRVNITR